MDLLPPPFPTQALLASSTLKALTLMVPLVPPYIPPFMWKQ